MNDDFDFKSLTDEELDEIFSGIDFPLKPMRHQAISLAFGVGKKRISFLHDVGTGKTLCALYMARLWGCKKILVVAPASSFGSWRRDLRYHTEFSYSFIKGSGKERKQELKHVKDVHVITYAGLKTVYAKLVKGHGWKIQFDSFIHNFDCVIYDEDHKCANHEALQSEISYELSKRAEYVIGMTGTPIDKSYLELFNIYRIIDLGQSLGRNFFAYRFAHFDKKICGSKWGRKWVEWEIKPGHEEQILDKISGVTISFSREECFDLPPIQKIFKFIHPSNQFLQFQEDIIDKKKLTLPNGTVLKKGKIKAIAFALRELPSGFFYYDEDKKSCVLKKNPKMEALLDLLEDSSSKIIVFYTFVEERNIIAKALRKAKVQFCEAYGGQDSDERVNEIERFGKDPNVRILVSQVTVANAGYDAFAANVVVFFSPLSSPKMIKQCIGRAYRKGQKQSVLVITFVMEDSIEERVIVNRSERFDLVKETMAYIRDFHKSKEEENV
jgi:SNF2 family DNA or RNA helicase